MTHCPACLVDADDDGYNGTCIEVCSTCARDGWFIGADGQLHHEFDDADRERIVEENEGTDQ